MRAVTVRVNDVIGVAGFLLPGNRVDVVAARREAVAALPPRRSCGTSRSSRSTRPRPTDKNEPVVVRAVTLEVTPAEAEILVGAEEEGSIQLALRNPLDEAVREAGAPPRRAAVNAKAPPPRRVP